MIIRRGTTRMNPNCGRGENRMIWTSISMLMRSRRKFRHGGNLWTSHSDGNWQTSPILTLYAVNTLISEGSSSNLTCTIPIIIRNNRGINITIGQYDSTLLTFSWSILFHLGLCLAQPSSEKDLYLFRKNGYRRLNSFIRRLSRREVHLLEMKLVFWCCLNLLTYFHERCRSSTGCNSFIAGRKARGSKDLLCHLLDILMPENQFEVARNTILYFTCTCQWDFEDVVIFVFQVDQKQVKTKKNDALFLYLRKWHTP